VPAGPQRAVDLGREGGFLPQFADRGLGGGLSVFDAAAGKDRVVAPTLVALDHQ
jgi:hypothetical protein